MCRPSPSSVLRISRPISGTASTRRPRRRGRRSPSLPHGSRRRYARPNSHPSLPCRGSCLSRCAATNSARTCASNTTDTGAAFASRTSRWSSGGSLRGVEIAAHEDKKMNSTLRDPRTARLVGEELSQRYPDPAIRAIHPSFAKYYLVLAGVELLATGTRWGEGPVWFGDGRYLLWSDIPNDRILRWDEESGHTTVFRSPSSHANGNTRDRQGRLVTCEHSGRRVSRTEIDGAITVICDSYDGKRLNSPNDVVVKSDGSIWFTDPAF